MSEIYDHREIEPRWQNQWEKEKAFVTPKLQSTDKKAYILDFFPYPSGAGLHVGHLLGYTGSDILARAARMQGKKVLHPMGWDAFGLPAENFAIKSGIHPAISTEKNIKEYKRQFRQTGISYDWEREINTSDPSYYKWTQWLFTVLYKRGLAYRHEGMVNWCPSCQTVLANEQVIAGQCERCGSQVIQKRLKQWYFKITQYADRLLNDLDSLDWPESIKIMQRNWIGKSEGAEIHFAVQDQEEKIKVFTTRPDTIFGATYLVLAPEHPLVEKITSPEQESAVSQYRQETAGKSELERTFLEKKKTGVLTGGYAINPLTHQEIPIWIADYVLLSYGTGAIMAVPAHDQRDFEFAREFGLKIQPVIEPISNKGQDSVFVGEGTMINSDQYNGLPSVEVKTKIIERLEKEGLGQSSTVYRLRDWLVSRQRFWGVPIPVVYNQEGQEHILALEELPVQLPMDVEFVPTGQSPLAQATEWKTYIHPTTGQKWQREVDTLDTFVCSSWYYLRFCDPANLTEIFSPQKVKEWLPVDRYIGGAEHAVLHLLYARFFTKVLFDEGLISFEEPFLSLRNPGMILGPDHNKMSKSKGNVINPDEVLEQYGADTFRIYEMFMGPFDQEKPWSTQGIIGIRRFLEKVWRLREIVNDRAATNEELRIIHRAIKKVTEDIANLKFNTAVACLMEAVGQLLLQKDVSASVFTNLIALINPFAPHITEEIWHNHTLGEGFCSLSAWPEYDQQWITQDFIEYPIQINGKVRARVKVSTDLDEDELKRQLRTDPTVVSYLEKGEIEREILIPGRLFSLVLKKNLKNNL